MIQTYSPDMKPLFLTDKKIVHQKGLWHIAEKLLSLRECYSL